jgi:hypothetical protein
MAKNVSHKEVMMNNDVELIGFIDNPPARRLWLLHNAVRSLPFDRAIELARIAEAFVTGSPADQQPAGDTRVDAPPSATEVLESADQIVQQISSNVRSVGRPLSTTKRTRLTLPVEQRERLLQRLVEGAKNAELATEFGLSLQQVQGLRIGCAREIAKRREQRGKETAHSEPIVSASIEEIVRFLRQQNDVVVSQENGFLVNGRFRMPFADLIARANRMRSRQGKPVFLLTDETPVGPEKISSANGHSLPSSAPTP